ncbi:uncharacterized protein THITE_2118950 [Thermothielavioides terrestris NRRL 8126]|uniref:TIP41-like protein n=1 Tax=Thermothielavioides terrestris (strain ATCC 38088 / NRRL 8126) TaxID=578455 RepID=G2RB38_THETT|nr:uncharacterized protein THITE_2118950 [Thermothielavioides terrestris NRRL 8126]AEO69009.1 hypothetical protein THITE_2118950 [Thermothielavioides terrestris NRRL 8126]
MDPPATIRPAPPPPPPRTDQPFEPYPSPSRLTLATRSHTQGAFHISARKLPILKAGPIDAMAARLRIPVPEMIFGDNLVCVAHPRTGWSVSFGAEAALDTVDKTGAGGMLRVAHATAWSSSRERSGATAGISEVVRPFDWSYSARYLGDEVRAADGRGLEARTRRGGGKTAEGKGDGDGDENGEEEEVAIPVELLKRRDPILFADEVVLYESELDDNGISVMSVKFRVMEQRMLLLCRLFMRLDGVLVRVRDTRVYVDFEKELVIREYTAREDTFDNVKQLYLSGLMPDAITAALRDSNQVVNLLPVVESCVDSVCLAPKS